ncbi:MAG: KEOPS complex subunit Pcc1 [Candidatus Micrarchaeaceae archaeon]
MPNATIKISIGEAKDYIKVMDKEIKYKRSKISVKESKDSITINIASNDSRALLASMNSIMKQLNVISSVKSLV